MQGLSAFDLYNHDLGGASLDGPSCNLCQTLSTYKTRPGWRFDNLDSNTLPSSLSRSPAVALQRCG